MLYTNVYTRFALSLHKKQHIYFLKYVKNHLFYIVTKATGVNYYTYYICCKDRLSKTLASNHFELIKFRRKTF